MPLSSGTRIVILHVIAKIWITECDEPSRGPHAQKQWIVQWQSENAASRCDCCSHPWFVTSISCIRRFFTACSSSHCSHVQDNKPQCVEAGKNQSGAEIPFASNHVVLDILDITIFTLESNVLPQIDLSDHDSVRTSSSSMNYRPSLDLTQPAAS